MGAWATLSLLWLMQEIWARAADVQGDAALRCRTTAAIPS